ncbi:RNA polymerase sigma-70 factor (family 1) [Pedobacter sp. UYP30]|uniref:RNA polymerase sigma factor n=1 Tax=Pedobacter sp. UYP30 TaxID=1756400 RepID=UPI0033982BC1
MIPQENDNEILRKIALRDTAEFDKLYRSQYRKLFLLSFKYTRNQEVSEEAVHDVFIKIWNQSSTLNVNQSLNAYLARATINTSLNALKKQKNRREKAEDFNTDPFFTAIAESVSEEAEDSELRMILLEQAISKLPKQCKKILLMSKFQKLKQQQIADELNISIKTVKNHLTYAYKKLKDQLGLKLLLITLVFFYIGLLGFKFV